VSLPLGARHENQGRKKKAAAELPQSRNLPGKDYQNGQYRVKKIGEGAESCQSVDSWGGGEGGVGNGAAVATPNQAQRPEEDDAPEEQGQAELKDDAED
jgi:hypothetical protein